MIEISKVKFAIYQMLAGIVLVVGLVWYLSSDHPPLPIQIMHEKSKLKKNSAPAAGKIPDLSAMVLIPAGESILGTDPAEEEKLPDAFGMADTGYQNEAPRQRVFVKAFYIDRYEVTFGEYENFIKATGAQLPKAWVELDINKWRTYPAQGVTWTETEAYLKWAGKRLPTEMEWEKAARGPDGSIYVFGNKFDPKTARNDLEDTIPVAETGFDESFYGVYGMSGNLSEWCADFYGPHPKSDYHDPKYGKKYRVYKGGAWVSPGHYKFFFFYRCARRGFGLPDKSYGDVGFRGAYSP